ncbi:tellurite resistance/C4-dicarboxylate transporter family protein [Streptacidiphilus pinicola]|uniref:tellurite resistance/C4-dicarboxylate transporter family protein n=1 Tax=Streptacidiphilus pinicola TaxID=2219663 RepID=UPI001A9F0316|nr:tellurite resistance/C4-dicarboxylate transporter family protein [Streptacidiphilus pinicola]
MSPTEPGGCEEPPPGGSDADREPDGMTRAALVREGVRTLHPGYFALVMATGIVSIAMRNQHAYPLSVALLWLAGIEYAVLALLTVWRLARYRPALAKDLTDPRRAFGTFTLVAGTDVLGTRLAVDGHHTAGFALLALGWAAWLVLGYVVPWTAVLRHVRRPVLSEANGTWFIWVVASQSVAVLAAALEPAISQGRRELALLAVFSWSVGVFLYAGNGVLVTARMLLYSFGPEDLTPPYWVAMGATAITVVAGARIIEMADAPMIAATRGLIAGSSVLFWAFGSWLIPPLIAAGIWRHLVHRVPLRYDPTLWSIVFPLGMYAVAGSYLGQADHLPIVKALGDAESWAALAAWFVTFAAMARHLLRAAHTATGTHSGATG